MTTPVMELPDGRIKYSDGTIGPKPATRNLFDFGNASIQPATKTRQTTNEQIMARLLPQGTVTQQIRQTTAPVIETPATPTAVKQMQNKPLYSDSTKLAIWKQHGGDESNFDTNDFNRSASGAIYLKNEAISKIKPKEAPSIFPQASAEGEPATLTEEQIRQLANDGATDEEILRVDAYERQKARMAEQKAPETIETEKGGLFGEGGLLYNIGEQIVTGGERIGEAYKGYQEGEYTAPEAIARGAAGTTQVIFSGPSGLLTATAQDVQKKLGNWVPDDIKQDFSNYVTTQATPVAESVQNWYNKQSPEQKRRLENAGIGTELLLDLLGFKGGKKVAPKVVPALEQMGQTGAKGVVKVVKAPITGTKQVVTRTIPKKVVSNDLGFTPTERAKIAKITGRDEASYVLEKNLAGKGKEEMAEHFMNQSNDMYNGITEKLANTNVKVKSNTAKEALQDIVDQLESNPKLKRAYQSDIDAAKAMMEKGEYTLSDLNNIRRAYDKVNTGMYTAQGQVRSGLENEIDVRVRNALSEQLQKEAEKEGIDIKEMNKELRAGLVMKDALLRRLSQEERNNFIGIQDLGVSAILSGGNPITAVATIAAKKYGEKIAPTLSQKVYNLSKKTYEASRVNRGNTITPSNKPNGLGLTSVPRNTNPSVKITPTWKSNKPGFINPKAMAEDVGIIKKEPLIEEAKKYKNVDDFVKNFFMYKPPKKLYRGVASEGDLQKRAGGTSFASLGKGVYTTRDKSFAKKFGKVIEMDTSLHFPRNPLVIERPFGPAVDALKDWLLEKTGINRISEFHKKYGDDYSVFLKNLGYDGAVIGDEIVKFDNNLPLEKIYKQAHKK